MKITPLNKRKTFLAIAIAEIFLFNPLIAKSADLTVEICAAGDASCEGTVESYTGNDRYKVYGINQTSGDLDIQDVSLTGKLDSGSSIYELYGIYSTASGTSTSAKDITIVLTNASLGSPNPPQITNAIAPFYSSAPDQTINLGNLSLDIQNIFSESTSAYGIFTLSATTKITSGSVFVSIKKDSSYQEDSSWTWIMGIDSYSQYCSVNGDVTLALSNIDAVGVIGVDFYSGGQLNIGGNLTVNLDEVIESQQASDITTALWVGGLFTDTPPIGTEAKVSGMVNFLFNGSQEDSTEVEYGQDIAGVVVAYSSNKVDLTLEKGVNVAFSGDGTYMEFDGRSVFGAVLGTEVNAQYEGSTYRLGDGYTRNLFFGYTDTLTGNDESGASTSYTFTSSVNQTHRLFSFSNFDTLTISTGSHVVLTMEDQSIYLSGTVDAFYQSLDNDRSNEVISLTGGQIDGIRSYAGRLYLSAASDNWSETSVVSSTMNGEGYVSTHPASVLFLQSQAIATIMQLQNNGYVYLYGDGNGGATLNLMDADLFVSAYSTDDSYGYNKSIITDNVSGSTRNSILNFYPSIQDEYTSSNNVSVSAGLGTFYNESNGVITVSTMNVAGASVQNEGVIGSGTEQLTLSDYDGYGSTYEAELTNTGANAQIAVKTLEIASGALINSDGAYISATTFNLSQNTDFQSVVNNSSTLEAGVLNVSGGTLESTGVVVSGGFQLSGGLVAIEDGDFAVSDNGITINNQTVSSSTTLTAGTFVVGTGSSQEVEVQLRPTGDIGSKVFIDDSKLGFGPVASETSNPLYIAKEVLKSAQNVENNFHDVDLPLNLLALTTPVSTDATGYIGVGVAYSGAIAVASASTPALAAASPSTGGLEFGSESTLIIRASAVYTSASDSAFTTTAGTEVTVDSESAKLIVGTNLHEASLQSEYIITQGYSYDTSALWTNENIIVVDNYGDQYDYEIMTRGTGEDAQVYLYRESEEPVVDLCELGYVVCHNIESDVEADLEHPDDQQHPGWKVEDDIVGDEDEPLPERIKVMDSLANLPFAGGVIGAALNGLMGDLTELNNHLTMNSDTFGAHGVLWPYEEQNNIWLNVTGSWFNQKHLKASGIDRAGWRADAFGFILGYDRKLKNRPAAIGAAFSYTGGNVKSTGNIDYTTNKYKQYGIHLWSNWSPNEHFNLIGAVHWMRNNADVQQNVSIAGYNKANAAMHTDWLAVGVRAETQFSAGVWTFVPHIEPRYVFAKMRNFDTKVDGITIWNTHSKGVNLFQIPVGIAARADFLTERGWTWRPDLDITVTPQVGATKLRTEIHNDIGAVDKVEGQFMGRFQGAAKLGLQIERKNITAGIKYGIAVGDRGKIDHGFIAQARLRF